MVLLLDTAIVGVWLTVGLIVRLPVGLPVRLIVRLIGLDARISRLHGRDCPWWRSYADCGAGIALRRGGLNLAHL